MKPVAIITARGGSKRIPKKNIKDFCGKPIIAYSIEAALGCGLFDDVVVSTDSEEIAEISRQSGASVPFMRSAETSNDYADTSDVLLEVINELKNRGKNYEIMCCIYPTAPFVTSKKLTESYALLENPDVYNAVTMVKFSFPPQRGMYYDKFVTPCHEDLIEYRSQDLQPVYHDCGQLYWIRVDEFRKNRNILYNHTKPYFVSEMEVQDIDNETDWELAELKYRMMINRG